jgi:hypothetical protein
MRNKRFIAEHRGGPLSKEHHRLLIQWACDCVSHALPLYAEASIERLKQALNTATAWQEEKASVGDARNASFDMIALAKELSDPASIALARATGHAVATAHMADHCLQAALYILKAVKAAGKSVEAEQHWQDKQLPTGIRELVLSARVKN